MSFRTIREAQQAIWPAVTESLELHRAQRDAVKRDPDPTTAAKARARVPWNRVVANETVWALAKQGLLATPEQAAVIEAAQEWAKSWGDGPSESFEEPEDVKLYAAIQALATVLDPPDDESFPIAQEA